jgi:hypothetical protein
LTEFTVQADFTVHSAGLSVNSVDLSEKLAGWGFLCSNFELNGFRPIFIESYRIRPIFLKTDRIRGNQFFSLHRFLNTGHDTEKGGKVARSDMKTGGKVAGARQERHENRREGCRRAARKT